MAITLYGNKQNVIQVVQTVLATAYSATSSGNTFADITGLSVSITPSSASNKILVFANVSINSSSVDGTAFRILRDSTPVGVGSPAGSRSAATGVSASVATNGSVGTTVGTYLDSPATTSAITYKIQGLAGSSGGTFYVNRTGTYTDAANGYSSTPISSITVMEVAFS
jgi:hypothetical protein